jgi:hypothetical protein
VREFRTRLAEWVTLEIFQRLGDGEQIRMHFLTAFSQLLDAEYAQPTEDPYLDILVSLITRKQYDLEILPALLTKSSGFYLGFCEAVDQRLVQALRSCEPARATAFRQWAQNYFVGLFERAHATSLAQFKERLARMGEWVDSLQMECIAQYMGYNFVFIREEHGDGYPGLAHVVTFDPDRKCIVFLWVDQNHFEIIGELERKNIINRVFDPTDVLIDQLRDNETKSSDTAAEA